MSNPTPRSLLFLPQYFSSFPLTRLFTITEAPGEVWILIRGDVSSIREGAAVIHYEGGRAPDLPEVPEALGDPIWSDDDKEYLAYGVDLKRVRQQSGEVAESWVFSAFDIDLEYLDPRDRDRIHPDLATKVKAELKVAADILDLLDLRGGLRDATIDRTYTGDEVATASGGEAAKLELRRARKVMDERLAAINFGLLHAEPATKAAIELMYAPYVGKWQLLSHTRGVQLDLRTLDVNRTHVLDLLLHKVPVFFPLDARYRPRLSESEARAIEAVRSGEEFCYWIRDAFKWPVTVKGLPAPSKIFGVKAQQELANPGTHPTKAERWANLLSYVKVALGDTLHIASMPVVPTLAAATVTPVDVCRLVIDPVTEIRMAVRAIQERNSDPGELLQEALTRGWAFRVVYPRDFLDDLSTEDIFVAEGALDEIDVLLVVTESEDIDVMREWHRYLRRAYQLLSRPNAKAFLFLGGIFWRLAILLGGRNLNRWMRDVLTLSTSVLLRRSGTQLIRDYWCDGVSEYEKNVLLGLTRSRFSDTTRTWFPPQDLLEKHCFDDGEWTRLEEYLVMERYDSMQRGECAYRPLTRDEWDRTLHDYRPAAILRDSYVAPTSIEVNALLRDIRAELGGSWKGATLADIREAVDVSTL